MTDAEHSEQAVDLLPVEPGSRPAPDWTSDLIIYQVAPRGFTSPEGVGEGSGSGTFRSLEARLAHIQDVGATAIWLAGFHEATDHFYGIWSTYAAIRHDRLDPALGTEQDFRSLIASAHRRGIRVLLEVVSHGVVHDSPLVEQHPQWFLEGGSWGMRDFDYRNPQMREWWIRTWVHYVTEFGIDGFRVDLTLVDRTVWDEICRRCAEAGHPIVVIVELERYHLGQRDWRGLSPDIAADFRANQRRFEVMEVSCHDAGWVDGPGNHYRVRARRALFGYAVAFAHRVPLFFAGEEFDAEQVSLPRLTRGIFGAGGPGGWLYGSQLDWSQLEDPDKQAYLADFSRMLQLRQEHRDVVHADRWQGQTLALACHPESTLVPYARCEPGVKAVVVVGNEAEHDIELTVEVRVEELGFDGSQRLLLTDIWNGGCLVIEGPALAAGLKVRIRADDAPGGGIGLLTITPADGNGEPLPAGRGRMAWRTVSGS